MDVFTRGIRTLNSARDTAAYIAQQKEQVMGKKQKQDDVVDVQQGQMNDDGSLGILAKTRSVLNLADDQPFEGFATFQQPDDDADDDAVWSKQYQMPVEDWDDFGRPDTITITVKPGDLLNDDKPEHE